MLFRHLFRTGSLAPICLVMTFTSAVNAAGVWDGGDTTNNWSSPLNWDDDLVPVTPAALTFGGTTRLTNTNDIAGFTANGITFASGAGPFVIGGNGLTLGGDIVNNSTNAQTLNTDLALSAARTVNAASGDVTLGGAVTGAFALNKTGTGKLTLSGTSGTSHLNASAGTVELSGAWTQAGTITGYGLAIGSGAGANGTVNVTGGTHTFGGDAFGSSVRIGATGGTGSLQISGGTVKVGTTGATDASINLGAYNSGVGNGTISISGNGTLEVGRRILMGTNGATNTGTLTISGNGVLNMVRTGSNAEGDLGMVRLGNGTGTVNFNGGTYIATGLHTSAATSTTTINFNGTEIRANASGGSFGNGGSAVARVESGGLVINTNGFDTSLGLAVSNGAGTNGAITKNGTGQLSVTAANSYNGTTTVNGGTLRFAGTGTFGANAAVVMQNGTTLRFDRSDTFGDASSTPTATITANGATITNGGVFNTLRTVTLNNSSLVAAGGASAAYQSFKLNGTVTATGSSSISVSGTPANANTQIHLGGNAAGSQTTFNVTDTGDSLSVSAVLRNGVTGTGGAVVSTGFIKTGLGTMTLSGVNTYTATTSVQQGKLALTGSGSIASSATVDVASGAFLDVTSTSTPWSLGASQTLTGNGTVLGSTTIAGTLSAGNSIGHLSFSSDLSLIGTVIAEIDAGAGTADLVTAATMAFGGTLTLANLNGTLVAGQSFNLFDFTSATGTFSIVNLPDLDAGLSWDDSQLYTTGVLSVVPEPSVAWLALLGGGALLRRRRNG